LSSYVPAPTQSQVQQAIAGFLATVLPAGVVIVEGQDSLVPEPVGADYVVMTPVLRNRLATNIDLYADVQVTASSVAGVLSVSEVEFGTILLGSQLWGVNQDVPQGTTIVSQLGGSPGGAGTYQLSDAALTVGSETMACGNMTLTQPTDLTVQLDVHAANVRDSSDMAATLTTVFRDEVATDYFDALGIGLSPLYADEARQVPYQNAEQNWESRQVVDAHFEANIVVTVPMQFAATVQVVIHPVQ
jgi:hypothetical protein